MIPPLFPLLPEPDSPETTPSYSPTPPLPFPSHSRTCKATKLWKSLGGVYATRRRLHLISSRTRHINTRFWHPSSPLALTHLPDPFPHLFARQIAEFVIVWISPVSHRLWPLFAVTPRGNRGCRPHHRLHPAENNTVLQPVVSRDHWRASIVEDRAAATAVNLFPMTIRSTPVSPSLSLILIFRS
jgi:hypothetical protein